MDRSWWELWRLTTIAIDPYSIASDKQYTYNEDIKLLGAPKITRLSRDLSQEWFGVDKAYVGYAGNVPSIGKALDWFRAPDKPKPRLKDVELVILTEDHRMYHSLSNLEFYLLSFPYFAIGSGQKYALTALSQGKTPYEAVKIAGQFDPWTGMGYKEYRV